MKAVLMSTQPQWCEKIAKGEKKVEVRKRKPTLETPVKCYIYETKDKRYENIGVYWVGGQKFIHHVGKVIGEFVCDRIDDCIGQAVFEYTDKVRKSYKIPTKYGYEE